MLHANHGGMNCRHVLKHVLGGGGDTNVEKAGVDAYVRKIEHFARLVRQVKASVVGGNSSRFYGILITNNFHLNSFSRYYFIFLQVNVVISMFLIIPRMTTLMIGANHQIPGMVLR